MIYCFLPINVVVRVLGRHPAEMRAELHSLSVPLIRSLGATAASNIINRRS